MPLPFDLLGPRATDVNLSPNEYARYSRHLILPEVGLDGQKRLKASSVLLIGAGGLGSPLALYLAAAGVGRIGLIDFDLVDFSNLQRQVLHGTPDVGRPKLHSARDRIQAINPEVRVDLYEARLTSTNALKTFEPYDIIIDGTDNFPTRYLTNDACVLLKKPNVYGSIYRFDGQASVFFPPHGPCYRCLYPEPPPPGEVPSCAEGGVLGILPGVVGMIQATEAVKLILGTGAPLIGRLLHYDALGMTFREFRVRRNPKCLICGDSPTIKQLIDYEQFCGVRGEPAASATGATDGELTVEDLKRRIDRGEDLFILDVRNPEEFRIGRIPGSTLIPLPDLPQRVGELDPERELVVHCKSGLRSAKAVQFLRERGFKKLRNLKGGILAWAERIDPSVPKY
jgi:molybdopterin/thiamine biosynthesis adenylyltransferase/rhodanese-related sulfurtransferase